MSKTFIKSAVSATAGSRPESVRGFLDHLVAPPSATPVPGSSPATVPEEADELVATPAPLPAANLDNPAQVEEPSAPSSSQPVGVSPTELPPAASSPAVTVAPPRPATENSARPTQPPGPAGGHGALPLPDSAAAAMEELPAARQEETVRQTFVMSREQLEQLLDYVHARRSSGDYLYSQKQALQEALTLLFASLPAPILPRPAETRELEQQRRDRIRAGKTPRAG